MDGSTQSSGTANFGCGSDGEQATPLRHAAPALSQEPVEATDRMSNASIETFVTATAVSHETHGREQLVLRLPWQLLLCHTTGMTL